MDYLNLLKKYKYPIAILLILLLLFIYWKFSEEKYPPIKYFEDVRIIHVIKLIHFIMSTNY